MKLSLHGQIALWNLLLIAFAFVVFGFRAETALFATVAGIVFLLLSIRLRSGITRPLAELSESVQQASPGRTMQLPISQRGTEIGPLAAALEVWSQQVEARIDSLSDARLWFQSILSAMGEGVIVLDPHHRIVLANESLRNLIEVRQSPVGKTCLEVFRNESLDRSISQVLTGKHAEPVEFQAGGSGRTVRALLSPIRGEEGTAFEAVVMVLHDVTDIRQTERVRRDFVANVSHEFKTPLTSIRGYAETMLAEAVEKPEEEFLEIILRNARHLESLVNDLLELARLESELPSSMIRVDLKTLVSEQVMLRRQPGHADNMIDVDCPSMEVEVDPVRLSRALSNLIDNAIHYNRPDAKVRVSVRREGPSALIEVTDDGFGIPGDKLGRIFERFYRVDNARARNAGGTGLGLAIARHAVESQGGTLSVESRPGFGSTFTIRLPAAPEPL